MPLTFMLAIRPATPHSSKPVFKFSSGKLLTVGIVNNLLSVVSSAVGVPAGSSYSAHSLHAAQPTLMAMNPDKFTQVEIRASGRWQSDAADRYVRCKATATGNLGKKLYALQGRAR